MFKKLTFLLAGAGLVILAACNTDKCKDKNCGTNGTCNILTGACDCSTGYEGATCSTAWNAKFIGSNWVLSQKRDTEAPNNWTTLRPSTANTTFLPPNSGSASGLKVENLINYGCLGGSSSNVIVDLTLVSSDSFVVSPGTYCGYTVTGGGKVLSTGTTANSIRGKFNVSFDSSGVTRRDIIYANYTR